MTATAPPAVPEGYELKKSKKPIYKRTWFLVLAGLIVLGGVANAGDSDGGGETSTANDQSAAQAPAVEGGTDDVAPEPATPEPAEFGIGQPAADGKFSFVVNGFDCSTTEVGNEHFGTKAQGQFCIVDVTVSNVGDEPQSFFGDNAKLLNAQGQEFGADGEAAMYLEDSSSLYEEINPGNTLQSKVVFDVPAGMVPTAIELHDSAFSGGVTVSLQ